MINDIEIAIVDKQVAVDLLNALLPYPPQQLPNTFSDQERITAALNKQITAQSPILNLAESVDVRIPAVGRPQNIKRDQRCQKLYRGTRVARHIILPLEYRIATIEILNIHTQRVVRQLAVIKCAFDRQRQF